MNAMTRLATRNLQLIVAAMLSIVAPAAACAADTASDAAVPAPAMTPRAGEELEQLDEVLVRGRHLAASIADAEDDFFKLYNKLNRNHDYDVTCGYMSLEPGSLIMRRTCMPGFLADYYPSSSYYSVPSYFSPPYYGDTLGMFQCNNASGGTSGGRDVFAQENFYMADCAYLASTRARLNATSYSTPLMALSAMTRRQAYADNVMQVIYSDPTLLEKARKLAGLYQQMKLMQSRYTEVREQNRTRTTRRHAANPNER